MDKKQHYFLSGIGGSGMLPLALILKGLGCAVSGSDRGREQGRTPEKFAELEAKGIKLFPQDGSGPKQADVMVVSSAIEDTVPDVVAAREGGIPIIKRAALLAELFNSFPRRIAVGGTSGKTTVTGMIGHILQAAGMAPTLMCGGVLKNYNASALVGTGDIFVTEADESDGSIALYNPDVAVLTNISIDHKSMDELRALFTNFTGKSRVACINADNAEAKNIISSFQRRLESTVKNDDTQACSTMDPCLRRDDGVIRYGMLDGDVCDLKATDVFCMEEGVSAVVHHNGKRAAISLELTGEHNLSNALAAIAAVLPYGVSLRDACDHLGRFSGIKRRMEWVGEAAGITVIDDFAHNPDKIAASLKALKISDAPIHVIFQMHGYGPLKLLWQDLAATFKNGLGPDDRVYMCAPLYLGGTADKSIGMQQVVDAIGPTAQYFPTRDECADAALKAAQAGSRIVVMGARDDTLSAFAQDILKKLM